jgi:hypothetical protein
MHGRALADRWIGCAQCEAQRVSELIEEQWNTVLEFLVRCARRRSARDPRPAPADDFQPVRADEFVQQHSPRLPTIATSIAVFRKNPAQTWSDAHSLSHCPVNLAQARQGNRRTTRRPDPRPWTASCWVECSRAYAARGALEPVWSSPR